MDDFTDVMTAAFDGEAQDPGADTPALESPVDDAGEAAGDVSGEPAETPSLDDAEPLFNREQYLAEHPELAPIAKQFQADYTRKMQELAEQRRQFEGVDEQSLSGLRYLNDLMARDPRAAAEALRQQAQQIEGMGAPDPYAGQEFATEVERIQAGEIQELKTFVNEIRNEHLNASFERGFAKLEKQYGEIPPEMRGQVARELGMRNLGVQDLEMVYKALSFETHLTAASRKARNAASAVVQQKAGMVPGPSGIAGRESATPREPQSVREALEMSFPI